MQGSWLHGLPPKEWSIGAILLEFKVKVYVDCCRFSFLERFGPSRWNLCFIRHYRMWILFETRRIWFTWIQIHSVVTFQFQPYKFLHCATIYSNLFISAAQFSPIFGYKYFCKFVSEQFYLTMTMAVKREIRLYDTTYWPLFFICCR